MCYSSYWEPRHCNCGKHRKEVYRMLPCSDIQTNIIFMYEWSTSRYNLAHIYVRIWSELDPIKQFKKPNNNKMPILFLNDFESVHRCVKDSIEAILCYCCILLLVACIVRLTIGVTLNSCRTRHMCTGAYVPRRLMVQPRDLHLTFIQCVGQSQDEPRCRAETFHTLRKCLRDICICIYGWAAS